jgi:hypothetical protein
MIYKSTHLFDVITEDSQSVPTDCNSISIENVGNVSARLRIGNAYQVLTPGAIRSFGNHPDVTITTKFDITFDTQGNPPTPVQQLDITREFISKV